jgi:hypothetical protein
VLRDALAHLTANPAWIPDAAAACTDAIHAALPELNTDADMRSSTYASTESVLRLLAVMVARGRPPSAAEPPPATVDYARELVRHGVAIDSLLRAYHIGHATFFEIWVSGLSSHVTDPAALARGIEEGATWTFEYVQALTRDLIQRYADERERWSAAPPRCASRRSASSSTAIASTRRPRARDSGTTWIAITWPSSYGRPSRTTGRSISARWRGWRRASRRISAPPAHWWSRSAGRSWRRGSAHATAARPSRRDCASKMPRTTGRLPHSDARARASTASAAVTSKR